MRSSRIPGQSIWAERSMSRSWAWMSKWVSNLSMERMIFLKKSSSQTHLLSLSCLTSSSVSSSLPPLHFLLSDNLRPCKCRQPRQLIAARSVRHCQWARLASPDLSGNLANKAIPEKRYNLIVFVVQKVVGPPYTRALDHQSTV